MSEIAFPHYWICGVCAADKGGVWPKDHCATVCVMRCEYCQGKNQNPNEAIAPWVDYNWPGRKTEHLRD